MITRRPFHRNAKVARLLKSAVVVELESGDLHASCMVGTHKVNVQGRQSRADLLEVLEREVRLQLERSEDA